jgi:Flp pilus assembly protein TadD
LKRPPSPPRRHGSTWTFRHGLGAVVLVGALALAGPAHSDPTDTQPEAALRDADYLAGKAAIERRDWSEGVRRLLIAARRDPDNPDLHNLLGYGYRNQKQFDRAFEHYRRALVLDPRHRGAHEYIGEAYLMVGDLPNAERHLAQLREICLLPCEELDDLQHAIKRYREQSPR